LINFCSQTEEHKNCRIQLPVVVIFRKVSDVSDVNKSKILIDFKLITKFIH